MIDTSLFQYVCVDPKKSRDKYTLSAYQCWYDTWDATYRELMFDDPLFSDNFTRQDEIGTLFYGEDAVALIFYRWVDGFHMMHRQDSYFRAWPDSALEDLCREGSRVCVSSNFTVAKGMQKKFAAEFSVKDVIVAMGIERFLMKYPHADVVAGTVRNTRGINKLIYNNGFSCLIHDVIVNGEPSDLAAFYRKSCTRTPTNERDEAMIQALLKKLKGTNP